MPDITNFDSLRKKMKGVEFNAPPEELLPSIMASMDKAIASLPEGANGAIVGIATQTGINAAVVAKVGHGFEVMSWIGRSWSGPIEFGAQVRKVW